jgi:DNA-binding NtrC family response regulator
MPTPHDGDTSSTLLMVDDDVLVCAALAEALRDNGYNVIEAANAAEAQSVLKSQMPIQAMISDIRMPGMDGIELAKWVRQKFPEIVIVLISGDRTADPRDAYFLQKPFPVDTLVAYLKIQALSNGNE